MLSALKKPKQTLLAESETGWPSRVYGWAAHVAGSGGCVTEVGVVRL